MQAARPPVPLMLWDKFSQTDGWRWDHGNALMNVAPASPAAAYANMIHAMAMLWKWFRECGYTHSHNRDLGVSNQGELVKGGGGFLEIGSKPSMIF